MLLLALTTLGCNSYAWHRAVRHLEEAGITAVSEGDSIGKHLWRAAKNDWRLFFDRSTWKGSHTEWLTDPNIAATVHNFEALAPALRRINPETLEFNGFKALENLDTLKGLTALRTFHLGGCSALQNVDGLEHLTALKGLILYDCLALRDVNGLRRLTSLRYLYIADSQALTNVDALKGLTSLQDVGLIKCTALENVDGLKNLTSLTEISLRNCSALRSVKPVKGLLALKKVDVTGCTKLPPEEVAALKAALPNARIEGP